MRCRTCYNEHDYRREEAPPKKDAKKEALFKEVLFVDRSGGRGKQRPRPRSPQDAVEEELTEMADKEVV